MLVVKRWGMLAYRGGGGSNTPRPQAPPSTLARTRMLERAVSLMTVACFGPCCRHLHHLSLASLALFRAQLLREEGLRGGTR